MRHYSENAIILTMVGAVCYLVYKLTTKKTNSNAIVAQPTMYENYNTHPNNETAVINGVKTWYA